MRMALTMNLQQLLGIELPIIQAPMACVQGSALAVAVSTRAAWARCPAPDRADPCAKRWRDRRQPAQPST